MSSRVQNQVNQKNMISDVQVGFRAGRGIRDQIVHLRLITEKATEFNQSLFMCSVDMGFPLHIIDLIGKCEATINSQNSSRDY